MLDVFRAGHLISNNQLMCFSLWKTILVSDFFMNLREMKKGCVGMLRETKRKKGGIVYLHDNLKKMKEVIEMNSLSCCRYKRSDSVST